MRALVTGGYGFIGSHLVQNLRDLHTDVLIADRLNRVQDISDADLDSVSIIYHLAATPRLGVSLEKPEEVITNNLTSTLRLLKYCREHPDVPFVNVSSSSVKFANLRENPYALSKKMGEDLVNLYRETYGIRATSVRFFNVYGPGESDYGKHTTLVKACKKAILTNQPIHVNGDGSIRRDYTHVSDVVSGLLIVGHQTYGGNHKPLYELGACRPTSVKQVVEAFAEGTKSKVIYGPSRMGDAALTEGNPMLAPLNWIPQIDILDYIREWKAQGCPDD